MKRFPGVLANDCVDFEARPGEIHALLGENGAGKTTLMKILYGIYQPDEGDILIRGSQVSIQSPREAIELGIGMVHQHFMLVPTHTVSENIVLGFGENLSFLSRQRDKESRNSPISTTSLSIPKLAYGNFQLANSSGWKLSKRYIVVHRS